MESKDVNGAESREKGQSDTSQNADQIQTHPVMKALDDALVKAVNPGARHIEKLHSKNPNASRSEIANQLERDFRQSVTVTSMLPARHQALALWWD